MIALRRNESAALRLLDELEARAHELADEWRPGALDADRGEELVDASLGVVPCLFSGERALVPVAASVSDQALEAFALLLTHAHTLIALSRIAVECVACFAPPAWPFCRQCWSDDVVVSTPSTSGAYRITCCACGHEMSEIGPPPTLNGALASLRK